MREGQLFRIFKKDITNSTVLNIQGKAIISYILFTLKSKESSPIVYLSYNQNIKLHFPAHNSNSILEDIIIYGDNFYSKQSNSKKMGTYSYNNNENDFSYKFSVYCDYYTTSNSKLNLIKLNLINTGKEIVSYKYNYDKIRSVVETDSYTFNSYNTDSNAKLKKAYLKLYYIDIENKTDFNVVIMLYKLNNLDNKVIYYFNDINSNKINIQKSQIVYCVLDTKALNLVETTIILPENNIYNIEARELYNKIEHITLDDFTSSNNNSLDTLGNKFMFIKNKNTDRINYLLISFLVEMNDNTIINGINITILNNAISIDLNNTSYIKSFSTYDRPELYKVNRKFILKNILSKVYLSYFNSCKYNNSYIKEFTKRAYIKVYSTNSIYDNSNYTLLKNINNIPIDREILNLGYVIYIELSSNLKGVYIQDNNNLIDYNYNCELTDYIQFYISNNYYLNLEYDLIYVNNNLMINSINKNVYVPKYLNYLLREEESINIDIEFSLPLTLHYLNKNEVVDILLENKINLNLLIESLDNNIEIIYKEIEIYDKDSYCNNFKFNNTFNYTIEEFNYKYINILLNNKPYKNIYRVLLSIIPNINKLKNTEDITQYSLGNVYLDINYKNNYYKAIEDQSVKYSVKLLDRIYDYKFNLYYAELFNSTNSIKEYLNNISKKYYFNLYLNETNYKLDNKKNTFDINIVDKDINSINFELMLNKEDNKNDNDNTNTNILSHEIHQNSYLSKDNTNGYLFGNLEHNILNYKNTVYYLDKHDVYKININTPYYSFFRIIKISYDRYDPNSRLCLKTKNGYFNNIFLLVNDQINVEKYKGFYLSTFVENKSNIININSFSRNKFEYLLPNINKKTKHIYLYIKSEFSKEGYNNNSLGTVYVYYCNDGLINDPDSDDDPTKDLSDMTSSRWILILVAGLICCFTIVVIIYDRYSNYNKTIHSEFDNLSLSSRSVE